MTVSTLINRVVYVGNGSTTAFTVPFKVLDVDHLVVKRRLISSNEIEYTYIGTDYSYSGIGADAGTLTLDGAALSSLYQLEIERIVPYTQSLDIVNSGGFYPETVEEQLDITAMQIQQIAAQADDIETRALMVPVGDTAPTYEEFAETFRGDPGGNVESVGLFSTMALGLTAVPAGTDIVRTSGNLVVGVGIGTYARDAEVDAAYVIANPRTSFMTVGIAANLGFKLVSTWITPWTFGATGPNNLEDWVFGFDEDNPPEPEDNVEAVQACLDYVAENLHKVTGDFRGNWGITDHDEDGIGLIINQPRTNGQTLIGGTFIALGEMTDLIQATFRTSRLEGVWALHGGPFSREQNRPYADRLVENGFRSIDGGTAYIQEIRVCGFKDYGVRDHTTGNNIMLEIGMIWGESCGSFHEDEDFSVRANFSSRTDSGDDGGFNQLSVLGGIADTSEFRLDSLVHVTGTGTDHYVRAKTSNSVSVYPWLPHGTTSGQLVSMHGGIVSFSNNDSTSVEIGRLDGFHYGSLVRSAGLYGIKVRNLQGQIGSVTINLGGISEGEIKLNRGSHFGRVHSEENSYDLVQVSPGSTFEIGEVSSWGRDGDASLFTRTVALAPRFASGTLGGILSYGAGLQGSFKYQGRHYYSIGSYNSNRNDGNDTVSNRADGRPYIYLANTFTVNLHWDQAIATIWNNAGDVQVIVIGTGANRQPTGTVTVQPTAAQLAAGYTVNGAASVAISGLSGRADIRAGVEPGTLNWRVSWLA